MLRNLKVSLLFALLFRCHYQYLDALASDAIQRLDKFFAEVNSFQGQFIQIVYDENGEVIQEAEGDVALA